MCLSEASIRRHDIPGHLLAAASFIPGARAGRLLRKARGTRKIAEVKQTPKTPSDQRRPKSNLQPIFDEHLSEAEFLKFINFQGYRGAYQKAHPQIDIVDLVVHHALPKYAFKKYRGVIPVAEVHNPANLRGIPKDKSPAIHLKIHEMWNDFYDKHPTASARQLRNWVKKIDRRFGRHFVPRRQGGRR
jgi:hypothetical protein